MERERCSSQLFSSHHIRPTVPKQKPLTHPSSPLPCPYFNSRSPSRGTCYQTIQTPGWGTYYQTIQTLDWGTCYQTIQTPNLTQLGAVAESRPTQKHKNTHRNTHSHMVQWCMQSSAEYVTGLFAGLGSNREDKGRHTVGVSKTMVKYIL